MTMHPTPPPVRGYVLSHVTDPHEYPFQSRPDDLGHALACLPLPARYGLSAVCADALVHDVQRGKVAERGLWTLREVQ